MYLIRWAEYCQDEDLYSSTENRVQSRLRAQLLDGSQLYARLFGEKGLIQMLWYNSEIASTIKRLIWTCMTLGFAAQLTCIRFCVRVDALEPGLSEQPTASHSPPASDPSHPPARAITRPSHGGHTYVHKHACTHEQWCEHMQTGCYKEMADIMRCIFYTPP